MCCMCQIVPERVLKRLAADRKFSEEQRKNFADTIKIDVAIATASDPSGQVNPRCRLDGARHPQSRPRRLLPCTTVIMVKPCLGLKSSIRRHHRMQPQRAFFRKRNRLRHSMRRYSDEIRSMTRE